ncbi:glycosyltransferase family 39 protein [filamentous cyanobacterium LEGE 11480]|uniref:Glycosyltransferase family 39 protein n=1 Tax=Romeriopsis navalis LEGE 11480 TaxID=2777977 RepID=A0A928Z2X5_9CYAN|nr:glycosyltransferase family 39 protein [Romeriopsis navalis]MBE9028593.1 glycosyltransferase family 39 protein [Romeriopsis navalis LEGE 11480]
MTSAIVLRFSHLDTTAYWGDEVYSSLRIFGHTTTDLRTAIAHSQPVKASILQSFQALKSSNGIASTIASMAIEDSHIAPLYFVLARIWGNWFGDSVASLRGLSAVFGVLLIPSTYYLAIELFRPITQNLDNPVSDKLGWRRNQAIAQWSMILVASSPLQFLMAREARLYSLWTLTTVLSGAFLLRASRQRAWPYWILFSLTLTLNFYSNFLAVITFIGYVSYVLVVDWRDRQILQRFSVAASVSLLSFAPWLSIFLTRQIVENHDNEGFIGIYSSRLAVRNWFALCRRLFIDFNTTPSTSTFWAIALVSVSAVSLGLIVYAFSHLYKHTHRRIWWFILTLTAPLPLCFIDRSLQGLLPPRYLLPSYIGIQLTLAYLLGQQSIRRSRHNPFWPIVMAAIVGIGLLSCGQAASAEVWWNKRFSNCNPAITRTINQAPKPLIIGDGTGGVFFDHALSNLLSLSRTVKPETQFQIGLATTEPMKIADGFSDRFVVTPSKTLRDRLNQQYPGKLRPLLTLDDAYRGSKVCLWRLD